MDACNFRTRAVWARVNVNSQARKCQCQPPGMNTKHQRIWLVREHALQTHQRLAQQLHGVRPPWVQVCCYCHAVPLAAPVKGFAGGSLRTLQAA